MEHSTDLSALAGQAADPDTFRRVWERVVPDAAQSPVAVDGSTQQTSGQNPSASGATVPDTAVAAQPSPAPSEGSAQELPPVPTCPPTEQPGSGADGADSGDAPLCLGEQALPYAQRLQKLMLLAQEGATTGRRLACRAGGACARALSALSGDHRRAFRQLSTAYFLITGERYRPECAVASLPASLPLSLRQQFGWEQRWEQANQQAAQETDDPCLQELFTSLAQEGALHAGTIRSLLERM